MRASVPRPLLRVVVEYYVEGAAVVCDAGDGVRHMLLSRQQQCGGVEVLRARGRDLGDLLHAGDDARGGAEHAAEQVDDDREHDDQQGHVADPPERHRGLLSATIAALLAIPGSAPRMTSNWPLIAVTA